MNKYKVFVLDDEDIVRITLSDDLKDLGYDVFEYSNPLQAISDFNKYNPEIIFTDVRMPKLNGIEFLKRVKKINPNTHVIVMTGYGSVRSAVEAVKAGAYDYISKPLNFDDIKIILNQINKLETLQRDFCTIIEQTSNKFEFSSIIGHSKETNLLIESIKLISNSNVSVLIQGETGTGKELVANIIHYNSLRKQKPFIKVSCAILSKEIFESELFGHEMGAFTGAIKDKKGRFELANGGTLYLDDIDDIPLELQVKLLRVLEEGEFEKVGGEKTLKVDVRIIASTKKDLREMANNGEFRQDLFFRLNVMPIVLKPLRERKEDIKDLFNHFLHSAAKPNEIIVNEEIFQFLENYHWSGNVRELKHLVERLAIISKGNVISVEDLPYEIMHTNWRQTDGFKHNSITLDKYIDEIEKKIILDTLTHTAGNKSKAAELLGIPYSTLRTKIEKHNI